MSLLKQSRAYTRMFLLVESSDHVTALAGAGSSPAVSISKAGGSFASAGGAVSELANGWYKVAFTTTDTNTLGDLAVHITMAAADPRDFTDQVVAVDFEDAVRFGLTALPNAAAEASGGLYTRGSGAGQINQPANGQIDANAVKMSGTALTGRDIGLSVLLSSGTGTGQLDFTSGIVKSNLMQVLGTLLTETAGQIAAGVKKFFNVPTPTSTMNELTLVDTVTTYTGNTPQTGDAFARLGAPAGASVSADIAEIETELDALTPVAIAAAVWDEPRVSHPTSGTFGEGVSSVQGSVTGSVDSVTDPVTAGTVSDKTGYALSSAGIQAIWDRATSFLTTSGSIGKKLADWVTGTPQTGDAYALLGTPAGASVSADILAVKSELNAIKADTDNIPSSPAAVSDIPTANQNADALLDRAAGVETNWTMRQAMRVMLAVLAGKLSGAATNTVTIRDTNDSKNRIVATVDSNGNRSAFTYDKT